MLASAVIFASASSSSCVRGRSRWAPLRRRGASWRSCKRRLVFLVCSLVDCRTDFRAKERKRWQKPQSQIPNVQRRELRNLTLCKILEFLRNPPLKLHFSFLCLFLLFEGFFRFGFCHLYRLLGSSKRQKDNAQFYTSTANKPKQQNGVGEEKGSTL